MSKFDLSGFLVQVKMEWHLQTRRAFFWFALIASFAMAFGATVQFAYDASGNVWANGGDAIATRAMIFSILGIIAIAGMVGDALSRDAANRVQETILATGASKITMGLGRFVVAFALLVIVAAMFVPGIILGSLVPGIPEERLGPFVWEHYAKALFYFVIPNFFLMSALIYAIAARWSSQTLAFVVALGLIALYVTALMLLGRDAYRHDVFTLYALLDPFGNIAAAEHAKSWTVHQNNTLFRPFEGMLALNRWLWIGIGILLVVVGTLAMPQTLRTPKESKSNKSKNKTADFNPFLWNKNSEFFLVFSWEMKMLMRQPGVLLLLAFAAFSLWWAAASAITYNFSLPTTDLLIHNSNYYFDKVLVLLLVWSSADIIWREQSNKVHELVDSLPTRDTQILMAKTLALIFVIMGFWVLSILVNILYQLANGFYDLNIDLYLIDTFIFKAPFYIWMGVFAIAMQVIIRQRFIAMGVVLLVYVADSLLEALGFHHALYRFGQTGFFWYSPMNGYGHFAGTHWLLSFYWTAAVAFMWILAWGCYSRGTLPWPRRTLWSQRLLRGHGRVFIGASAVAWVALGGFIYYQSMVKGGWPGVNENVHMAALEKEYRDSWGHKPQPQITAIGGKIAMFPELRGIEMYGDLTLTNNSDEAIDEIILFSHPDLTQMEIDFKGLAKLDETRSKPNVQIWQLNQALSAGADIDLSFFSERYPKPGIQVHAQHDGITEVSAVELIENGGSILNLQLMPAPGYSERLEHKPNWKRKKYGLNTEWQLTESSSGPMVAHDTTHLAWVEKSDITISTAPDQIPLYSGKLVADHGLVDGRRTLRYVMDGPSRGWSNIISGRYEVFKQHRDNMPPVELYYFPEHSYNLTEFSEALLDAMAYFIDRYGEPSFDTLRVAETSLQQIMFGARYGLAFVPETLGWKADLEKSQGEDLKNYASDLMAMNWWADQITPANVPGAKTILSGLTFWTSSLYLHQARTPEVSRKIRLQKMQEMYRKRAQLSDDELPFAKEMKDSLMVREKGALLIVYLAEILGQEKLESILASFLDHWKYRAAPYPSVEDLVAHFKNNVPEAYQVHLDDLFYQVTNWDLAVDEAQTWQLADGRWQVEAKISSEKTYAGLLGESEIYDGDIPVHIGVFKGQGYTEEEQLIYELTAVNNGSSTVSFIVDEKPSRIGIDPYLYLPDANPYDNVTSVELRENGGANLVSR